MKMRLSIISLLAVLLAFYTGTVFAADKLAVAVSQSRVVNFNGIQRVAIANPEIADVVVVSGTEALIVGKAPGVTTLHVWLTGQRLSYLVEVAADDVPIANEIKNILGYPDIKVSKINKTIILDGTVNSQSQKSRAEQVAAAYGDKVVNLLEITKPIQVKIEAKIVEINRERVNELGIKWGNSVATPGNFNFGQQFTNPLLGGLTGKSVFGGLGGYDAINAQLSAMVKNGSAKILSQPHLITLSGEKANIMVGGQIPVPVSMQNGQISIEWKDYGIKLDITPDVNTEGLIQSKVKAEVSSLDWNSTHKIQLGPNMYIPPLKLTKAEAAIAMASGQTMAIGGLISSTTAEDVTKVPLLGDIPVIGNLFKSKSFSRGETELIIILTPTIINPDEYLPNMTQEMKDAVKANPWGGNKDGGKNQGNGSR